MLQADFYGLLSTIANESGNATHSYFVNSLGVVFVVYSEIRVK